MKVDKGNAFIQKGVFKIIHVIDLKSFDLTLQQVDSVAEKIGKNNDFHSILENKILNLKKSVSNLRFRNRVRRSWEGLGAAIKWAAGNADADDLRDIYEKFDVVKNTANDLVKNNEKQIVINDAFQSKINRLAEIISGKISKNINETANSLDVINLMFNIDLAKEKLENIHQAVILAKVGIVSKNILDKLETDFIAEKLKDQKLYFSSLTEMLTYLSAEIDHNDDLLYYIINIPQIEGNYKKIHAEPITINNKEITSDFEEFLVKDNKTFGISAPCLSTFTNTLCNPKQLTDISDTTCIPQLLRDQQGVCVFKGKTARLSIKAIADGHVLIKNAVTPIRLVNTCGMSNHTVSGTFFVTFKNCSITINEELFENLEMKTKERLEILPFFNTSILQRNTKLLIDIDEIQDLHIENRKRIDELHFEKHQNTFMSTIMLSSIVAIAGFVFVIALKVFFFTKLIGIFRPTTTPSSTMRSSPRDESKLPPEELKQDQEIVIKWPVT